jgi:hypothetical protein
MAKIKNMHEWGRDTAKSRYSAPKLEPTMGMGQESKAELKRLADVGLPDDPNAHNFEAPQHQGNQRGPGYDNLTSEKWLTGAKPATDKPGFDHGGGAKGK